MSDFLEGVPKELHEQAIRKRPRLLEWIGVICGLALFAFIPGTLGTGGEVYILLVVVFVIITLIATYVYLRTKARLKS